MKLPVWSFPRVCEGRKIIICDGILTNGHFAFKLDFLYDTVKLPAEVAMLMDIGGNYTKSYTDKWAVLEGKELETMRGSLAEILTKKEGAVEVFSTNLRHKGKYDKTEVTLLYTATGSFTVIQSVYNDPPMMRPDMKCYWDSSRHLMHYHRLNEPVGAIAGMTRDVPETIVKEFGAIFKCQRLG